MVGGGDDEGLLMIRFKKGATLLHAHGTLITASQSLSIESLCHKSPLHWTSGHSFITDIWEMEDENFYWMKIFQKQGIKRYRRGSAGRECRIWSPVICDGIRDLKLLLCVTVRSWRVAIIGCEIFEEGASEGSKGMFNSVHLSGPTSCMVLSYSERISVGCSTKIHFL